MDGFFLIILVMISCIAYPLFVKWFVTHHQSTWFEGYVARHGLDSSSSQFLETAADSVSGIIFGRNRKNDDLVFSPAENEGHVFVVGGSGSGKTSALLIPSVRSWLGGAFVIDISGDISANIHCSNKLTYCPGTADSQPYNIFGPIDSLPDKDAKNEALKELAFLLIPLNERLDSAALFFTNGGRKILTASLVAFYYEGLDFIEICKKIVFLPIEGLFSEIAKTGNEIANGIISSFHGMNEQNVAGCKDSCDSAINFFATSENVAASIRRPRPLEDVFTPAMVETHKVFLIIPDVKLTLYSPLLRIIVAQCLAYFSARPSTAKDNILFCLDEFASLGRIDIVPALQKLRKKHVRIMVLTQSIADIDAVHGHDAHRSMMSNFTFRIILSAFDSDDQKYFGDMIGKADQKQVSTSFSGNSFLESSHTVRYEKEYIIDPAELGRLGKNLILLYPGGHVKLEKNFYFKKAVDKPSLLSKFKSLFVF